MSQYEYKVVPAPTKGLKSKGVKTSQDRFANALETTINTLGADGWEYQRTDTLPCEERSGLTGRVTTFQNMLVFRRAVVTEEVAAPVAEEPAAAATAEERTAETIAPEVEDTPEVEAMPLDADPARVEPQVAAE
ncbi:MAG: DUF4177 domain-containing protein [Yoonia sp.]